MNDYNMNANIGVNTKGFTEGIKNATKTLSSFIQNLGKNGLVGALGSVGLAAGGVGVAVGAVKKTFQAVAKVVGECSEAYKKQYYAETQLRQAVQNSNAVTSESTKVLLDYASALQKTSNYGDEELLPMMTKLIASGRSEAEAMKIMQTAVDMASTGTVSLDTAVTQLNQTLNGSAGRLAQQNAELKGLTEEELKNGKAVDILASKYNGMATKSIDTTKQLKNAMGDLKETLGNSFERALSPMRNYFATLIQGWADARKARQAYEEASEKVKKGEGTAEDLQILIENNKKIIDDWNAEIERLAGWYNKSAEEIRDKWDSYYRTLASGTNVQLTTGDIQALDQENRILQNKINIKKQQEEQAKATAEAEAQAAAEEQARFDAWAEKNKTAAGIMEAYYEKIAKQKITWEQNAKVLGEVATQEEKVKFYKEALVSAMAEANGLISEQNDFYKKEIAYIQQMEKEIPVVQKWDKVVEEFGKTVKSQIKDSFTNTFTMIGEALVNGGEAYEDYAATAVGSIAEVLKALAEQLTAQAAVNAATGNYAGAIGAAAGAAVALVAAGSLSAVANKMSAIKEAANDATTSIEKFKQTLKEIQESRFSKTGTITLGLTEMQEQLDTLREKQELLKKNSIVTYDAKTIKALENVGIRKDEVKIWHEYQDTLKQIKVTENELAEALENVRSSLDKTVIENRKVINSYKDFYGASKLIVDAAGYQYEKYSVYLDMIKNEQKASLQELQVDMYSSFQSFGKSIGEAMMSGLTGGGKEDFMNNFKSMIRENMFKMVVYTESFIDQMSEVGQEMINALMGLGDLESVTKKVSDLYDEAYRLTEALDMQIDEVFGHIEQQSKASISAFAKAMQEFKETIKDVTNDIGQTFINGLTEGITQGEFLGNIKEWLRKMLIQMVVYTDTIKAEVEEIGHRISVGIVEGFTDTDLHEIRRDLSFMFEEATKKVGMIDNTLGSVFGFAKGVQAAPSGLAMVGEAGPELVRFRGGEQVLNSRNTQKALNGMGGKSITNNITFNNLQDTTAFAMMQQMKNYNRQLAVSGII